MEDRAKCLLKLSLCGDVAAATVDKTNGVHMPLERFRGHVLCEDARSVVIAGDLYDCYDVGLYKLLDDETLDGYICVLLSLTCECVLQWTFLLVSPCES